MTPPKDTYQIVQTSILRNGHRGAVAYILIAVLVNHIRRILTPWLGQFVWYHALGSMKLAKSAPHYFLETSLSYDFISVLWWVGQMYVWSAVRQLVVRRIAYDEQARRFQEELAQKDGKSPLKRRKKQLEMDMDFYRVGCLALTLADVERAYTETCWVGAHIYAILRILRNGSPEELLFTTRLFHSKWLHVPLLVGLFLHWVFFVALPNIWRAIRVAGKGNLLPLSVYMAVVYGTVYLVRYSNKYFVLLEMSDMVITFNWMGIGAGFVLLTMVRRWWRRAVAAKT